MSVHFRRSRAIPTAFAAGLLAITLLAAFLPGPSVSPTSTARAACSSSSGSNLCPNNSGVEATTIEVIIALLAVVALVLGLLIWRDRRKGGRSPPPEWSDSAALAGPAAGATEAYAEGPEDVSVAPPELPRGAVTGAAAGEGGEGDIDSLMAELDRISGEILKQGPKGKKGSPPTGGSGGSEGGSN